MNNDFCTLKVIMIKDCYKEIRGNGMTKNEQIIKHIESLSIGSKISVRKIAKRS